MRCSKCDVKLPVHPTGYVGGTGYATLADGSKVCHACADAIQREDLRHATVFAGYLSDDGKHVTTWTGGILATVMRESVSKTGWHGSSITHIRAVTPEGIRWYGKGAGRGICIRIHRAK